MRAVPAAGGTSGVPVRGGVAGLTLMLMYASTHPWRSVALSLCGVAGLALAVGLGATMERGAPALNLASDAVVMPSATPLTAEPASTEMDVPAADGVRVPTSSTSPSSTSSPSSSSAAPPADQVVEEPAAVETSRTPVVGPAMPTNGDLDCADFERKSFPIDPANDPNHLDADADGLACEPLPGSNQDELDCADFTERAFRIDPTNDPNNLDADGDGLACEPPPNR